MNANPFPPITDKTHFPLLSTCAEQPSAVLMACDGLVFIAPEDVSAARLVIEQIETDWHLYGDTRWPCSSAWVEFPFPRDTLSGSCGTIILREDIPNCERDPLNWVASNNPLQQIFPQERENAVLRKRLELLRAQAVSLEPILGPADSTPKSVQCYCIFHAQTHGTPRIVATYSDLLNDEGIPIPKYRIASANPEDIPLCQCALHSLFNLNKARLTGMPFLSAHQLQAFKPTLLSSVQVNPKWAQFHPTRTLRTRPVLQAMTSSLTIVDGNLQMEDFKRVEGARCQEANLHMLAFDRMARPHSLAIYQADTNACMAAFIHRANGGAIYTLPDRLVEEFDKTDCAEVQIGDIQLPFPNIFLSFTPPQPVYLADGAPVDGCYLVRQAGEYLFMLTARLNGVDYPHSISLTCLDPTFSLHLPAKAAEVCISDAIELGIKDFFAANAPPEDDLSTKVESPDGTVSTIVDILAESRQRRIETFRSQEPIFRACLNIIVNAACFIAFRPDDICEAWAGEPPKEVVEAALDAGATRSRRDRKRDALKTIENGDFTRIRICGRDLFQGHVQHGATSQGTSPRAHWRRGHWRRQRHGMGLTLVVLRWIRPTVVNRDSSPLVEARIYDVQKPAHEL